MAAAQQQEQHFSAMIWRVGTNGDAADDDGGVQTNGWPFYFLGLAMGIFGVCVDMWISQEKPTTTSGKHTHFN